MKRIEFAKDAIERGMPLKMIAFAYDLPLRDVQDLKFYMDEIKKIEREENELTKARLTLKVKS